MGGCAPQGPPTGDSVPRNPPGLRNEGVSEGLQHRGLRPP
jgi:hypothetical protein